METTDYLKQYYAHYDEQGRLTTRHGFVEYTTTMHYIDRFLMPGMRILEIGAATGRYSHALAHRGFRVDAVELVEHNIELFRSNTQPGEDISITQGNAMDLSAFGDDTYDLTLLLGPMYHLFTPDDKHRALREAIRVTRPGGVIFAAYCMGDASVLTFGFVRGKIRELMEKCMLDPETFAAFSNPWDLFALHRTEDIDALMAPYPVTRLHFVAADGYANHMREALAQMDEETYQLYLKYHLATCERPDMLGYSHHTIDIFRKD